jgi:hypothetical protein
VSYRTQAGNSANARVWIKYSTLFLLRTHHNIWGLRLFICQRTNGAFATHFSQDNKPRFRKNLLNFPPNRIGA